MRFRKWYKVLSNMLLFLEKKTSYSSLNYFHLPIFQKMNLKDFKEFIHYTIVSILEFKELKEPILSLFEIEICFKN